MPETFRFTTKGIIVIGLGLTFLSAASGAYIGITNPDAFVDKATTTTTPPKPATELLGDDLTAAINAEKEKQEANAALVPAVKQSCFDAVDSLNQTLSAAGFDEKVTSEYSPPGGNFGTSYPAGFCAIYLNREFITAITKPNELEDEGKREYTIKELIKNLGDIKPAPQP